MSMAQVDISAVILLQATDLNGNGKKELVGVYALSVVDEKSQDSGIFKTPFVVWDNDEVEMLMPPLQTPRIFAGAIDIDQMANPNWWFRKGLMKRQRRTRDGKANRNSPSFKRRMEIDLSNIRSWMFVMDSAKD